MTYRHADKYCKGEGGGASPHWRTTRITYTSPSARWLLVTDCLPALADAAEGPWFWADLHRPSADGDFGVVDVGIATPEDRVPTQWFRDAVVRGLVERAVPIERSGALDPDLFSGNFVPPSHVLLLAATSERALDLLRMSGDGGGVAWSCVQEELATLYHSVVPEASFRRKALVAYAAWIERVVATHRAGAGSAPRIDGAEPAFVPDYDELGARLRAEIQDEEGLVVSLARLAHVQVLRLRPDAGDPDNREAGIARRLAGRRDRAAGQARTDRARAAGGSPARSSGTVFDEAARQLTAVCDAVGSRSGSAGVELLSAIAPWCSDHDASDAPRWSCLGDDCSPFEVSLATSASGYEVRFLVEAQSEPASPGTYWEAGYRLTRRLASELGLDLAWFDRVADLFVPPSPDAYWAMWHAVDLGEEPLVKVYLNPRIGGRPPDLVLRAVLARLGFAPAWSTVAAAMACGATPSHVSFDLAGGPQRLKVYLRHEGTDVPSLAGIAGFVSDTAARDFSTVCAAVCGDAARLGRRAPFTTMYFAQPGVVEPARVALHLPVQTYVPDDVEAAARVRSLLESFELDSSGYERARAALAAGNELSEGLHSYVGFQRDDSGPRVTIYFGARLYAGRHGWQARSPSAAWRSPVQA